MLKPGAFGGNDGDATQPRQFTLNGAEMPVQFASMAALRGRASFASALSIPLLPRLVMDLGCEQWMFWALRPSVQRNAIERCAARVRHI